MPKVIRYDGSHQVLACGHTVFVQGLTKGKTVACTSCDGLARLREGRAERLAKQRKAAKA